MDKFNLYFLEIPQLVFLLFKLIFKHFYDFIFLLFLSITFLKTFYLFLCESNTQIFHVLSVVLYAYRYIRTLVYTWKMMNFPQIKFQFVSFNCVEIFFSLNSLNQAELFRFWTKEKTRFSIVIFFYVNERTSRTIV